MCTGSNLHNPFTQTAMRKDYNMKNPKVCAILLLSCTFLSGCTTKPHPKGNSNRCISVNQNVLTSSSVSVPVLAREFQTLTNGHDRMLFAVRLVENGVIAIGAPLCYLKKIFGDYYADCGELIDGEGIGSVFLADAPEGDGNPMSTLMPIGWRMAIHYDDQERVKSYYFTNIWKPYTLGEDIDKAFIKELNEQRP